jgi:hypothetical protein
MMTAQVPFTSCLAKMGDGVGRALLATSRSHYGSRLGFIEVEGFVRRITHDWRIIMPRTLLLVILAVAISPIVLGQERRKTPQPSNRVRRYQAIIGQKEAVFTFPIAPGRQYEWCPGGLQYGWYVEVKNNRRDFDFGFYLFTAMGAAPCGKGDLQHLLEAGQFSVMGTGGYGEGTEQHRVLSNQAAVAGFANQSRDELTIKLSGENVIRLLFSGEPQYCVFKTKKLGKDYSTRVPLVYKSTGTRNALLEKTNKRICPSKSCRPIRISFKE